MTTRKKERHTEIKTPNYREAEHTKDLANEHT